MTTQPDLVLYKVLSGAFQVITQNAEILNFIFSTRPTEEIIDIQTWFATNTPVVKLGYQRAPSDAGVGAVYITAENEKEIVPYQFLGSNIGTGTEDTTIFDQELGSYFEANTKATCISTAANKTAYLAQIVKYVLLFNRQNIETNYGLQEQSISFGPLAPEKQMDPDIFVFRRDVIHNSKHIDYADVITDLGVINEIIIAPEVTIDSNYTFIVN